MTITYCSRCGFKQSAKTKCLWCYGSHDDRFDFTDRQIEQSHEAFFKRDHIQRKQHVLAMALEGFTPVEIHELTNAEPDAIEELLENAGIYKRKK